MFILSLKAEKNKLFALLLVVLLVIGGGILAKSNGWFGFGSTNRPSVEFTTIESDSDLIEFLAQFGWEVEPAPVEVIEIIIPTEFGEVYTNYNEIQKAQGFDLKDYMGENCKRYSYSVLNYPDFPSDVRANILVYNTKVIGGDISLIRIDGFMHGFIDENAKNS